jgi:hypothetical protein
MELCRLLPGFVTAYVPTTCFHICSGIHTLLTFFKFSIISPLLMAWSGAMKHVGEEVTKLVDERLEADRNGSGRQFVKRYLYHQYTKHKLTHPQLDCTQFVIGVSKTPQQRSPLRIVKQMVALQFASAHQLPMVQRLKSRL